MIVLDEELLDPKISDAIQTWYPGQVISVRTLRVGTVIKDESIPGLLLSCSHATFVTINISDFWLRLRAHPKFCVVCLDLTNEQTTAITILLRRLFALPQFKTKAKRMGMIALLRATRIEYYRQDHNIKTIEW